jgi:anaerobic magnesium-protoporphyrin IX monomethyl ester cyclase
VKLTLIQPPGLVAVGNYSTMTQPPLGLAYLAAYARRSGHEVSVVDAVGAAPGLLRPWPGHPKRMLQGLDIPEVLARVPADVEVLGVTCMFTHAWPMVRELLRALKRAFPGARLIAGGEHATAVWESVLRQGGADLCVLGEGEATLGELLEAWRSGGDWTQVPGIACRLPDGICRKTRPRPRIAEVDALPWPAWDLFDVAAYMDAGLFMGPKAGRSMPLLATRGCPFRCTFCSSSRMWTQHWKARRPESVVDEMERYRDVYGADDFQLQDLTAIVRKDWILAFCREILRRGMKTSWSLPVGTRSEVIDDEVARGLVASGCRHITYAPESGSERILRAVEKRVHLGRLEDSVRACLAAGMRVCLFQIIGFPQEEAVDLRKTFAWMRRMARLGVHEVAVSTFVPLPGTELFDELHAADPIAVDDDYCYWMSGATGLFATRSWNPRLSSRRLLRLKWWGLAQFYGLSFTHHPGRLWELLRNLWQGRQETKVDRVLREYLGTLRALGRSLLGRRR